MFKATWVENMAIALFFTVFIFSPGLVSYYQFGKMALVMMGLSVILLALLHTLPNLAQAKFKINGPIKNYFTLRGLIILFLLTIIVINSLRGFFSNSQIIKTNSLIVGNYTILGIIGCLFANLLASRRHKEWKIWNIFYIVLTIHLGLNIIGYLLGFQNPNAISHPVTQESARMLSWIGIKANRTFFPFSTGVNSFSSYTALIALLGMLLLFMKSGQKVLGFAGGFFGVITIMYCDSKGALLYALLLFFIALNFQKLFLKFGWTLVAAPFILPLIQLGLTGLAAQNEFVSALSRDGTAAGLITGREIMWGLATKHLSIPTSEHIFGYGLFGQAESGLSSYYQELFVGYGENSELTSLHNTVLQTIFDSGYVGVIIFYISMFIAIKSLNKNYSETRNLLFLMKAMALSFILIIGSTEVIGTIYQQETFFIMIFIITGIPLLFNTQEKSRNLRSRR